VLNGNNTFAGGVELGNVSTSTWQVGSDSAFGTGMIKTVQTSGSPTILAVGGSRTVPNDAVSFSFSSTYWTIGGSKTSRSPARSISPAATRTTSPQRHDHVRRRAAHRRIH